MGSRAVELAETIIPMVVYPGQAARKAAGG
jgi:hypothetical protein